MQQNLCSNLFPGPSILIFTENPMIFCRIVLLSPIVSYLSLSEHYLLQILYWDLAYTFFYFQVTRSKFKVTVNILGKIISGHYLCQFHRYLLETWLTHYLCFVFRRLFVFRSPGQRSRQLWSFVWKPFPVICHTLISDNYLCQFYRFLLATPHTH